MAQVGSRDGVSQVTVQYLDRAKESHFPRLKREQYHVTSKYTTAYNCIAHAAGRDDLPWWPIDAVGVHWPDGVPKEETIDCFMAAYATEGYVECTEEGVSLSPGFEKIALYVDRDGTPTHAARQLDDGQWTSKLGDWEDIKHASLTDLEDDARKRGLGYGESARLMKRPKPAPEGKP